VGVASLILFWGVPARTPTSFPTVGRSVVCPPSHPSVHAGSVRVLAHRAADLVAAARARLARRVRHAGSQPTVTARRHGSDGPVAPAAEAGPTWALARPSARPPPKGAHGPAGPAVAPVGSRGARRASALGGGARRGRRRHARGAAAGAAAGRRATHPAGAWIHWSAAPGADRRAPDGPTGARRSTPGRPSRQTYKTLATASALRGAHYTSS